MSLNVVMPVSIEDTRRAWAVHQLRMSGMETNVRSLFELERPTTTTDEQLDDLYSGAKTIGFVQQ